jgi:hypothetical protein
VESVQTPLNNIAVTFSASDKHNPRALPKTTLHPKCRIEELACIRANSEFLEAPLNLETGITKKTAGVP